MAKKKDCKLKGCKKKEDYYHEGYCSNEHYEEALKDYSRGKVIKQFLKQKLYEIGIIPTGLAALIFVPYWIGILLLEKIIKIDWFEFCMSNYNTVAKLAECTDVRNIFFTWSIGMVLILIIGCFIWFNWDYAKDKIQRDFDASLGADE